MNSRGKILRVGIAGSGFGKKVLLPAFSSVENVEVVALSGSRAHEKSDKDSYLPFENWRKLLEGPPLEALAIALPPLVQEEAARVAAEKGLHLFCEKPMALDPGAAKKIERECSRRNLKGMVDFEFRKIPVFQRLLASLANVGKIQEVEMDWMIQVPKGPGRKGSWKDDANAGGGAMSSFGCHLLDFCSIILRNLKVQSYKITNDLQPVPRPAEKGFELNLEGSSTHATLRVNTAAPIQTGLNIKVSGSMGTLVLEDKNPENYFGGFDLKYVGLDSREKIIENFQKNDHSSGRFNAVREMAMDFISAILDGKPIESNLKAGVENTRIIAEARAMAN